MPQNYEKKRIRCMYSEENFRQAIDEVNRGIPLSTVAAKYGVPQSTLGKHRGKDNFPKAGRKTVLKPEDEYWLVEYLKIAAAYGERLTKLQILDCVQEFVNNNEIK